MWGKLPGNTSPKFALARRALTENLRQVTTQRPSGLVIFGQSCTTASLTVPVQRQNTDRLFAPIKRLNPRGKGPLARALETATQTVSANATADVIVVHDGADNCQRDTCAIADTINRTHPNVRFHLLSIGLTENDKRQTRCIAQKTGGKVFEAEDAPTIAFAVSQLIANLKSAGPANQIGVARDKPQLVKPKQPEQTDTSNDGAGPSRIIATAHLGPGGSQITAPINWSISPADSGTDKPGTVAHTTTSAKLTKRLPAGRYIVYASSGGVKARQTVTVPERGAIRAKLAFTASQLTFQTPGATFSDGMSVTLKPPKAAEGQDTLTFTRMTAPILLPPGEYQLISRMGSLTKQTPLEVKAGSAQLVTPFDGYGLLQIRMANADGKRPSTPLDVIIEADAPDEPSGRRPVSRSASAFSKHILPAATYYVTVTVGGRATTQQIAVPANSRVQRSFKLQAATLKAVVKMEPNGYSVRSGTPVVFSVEDLQKKADREVAWSSELRPRFHLNPGRYLITARVGAHNVKASQTIEINPAQTRTVELQAAAAEISLKLEGQTVGRPTNRLWEVRNTDGDIIWRTNALRPNGLLAPGTYVVRCVTNQRILEGRFTVEAGTAQTIALVAE